LEQAQTVQQKHYDKLHRLVSYAVGNWVLLHLHHRAPASPPEMTNGKFKPCFFGPYRVIELINPIAVHMVLPPRAKFHNVFHVELLKKFISPVLDMPPPLRSMHHGAIEPRPEDAVRKRLVRRVRHVLVHEG